MQAAAILAFPLTACQPRLLPGAQTTLLVKSIIPSSTAAAYLPECMQAASYVAGLPASLTSERVSQTAMAAVLLTVAAGQRGADFSAILRAGAGLQAQCLALRSCEVGSGPGEGAPANKQPQLARRMRSLSGAMIHAAMAAQEAACHLLLKQHKVR